MTIKKQNPNFVLIVNLTSPDSSVDPVALSNYAYLQIVDPLKRLPGVGDVQIFGERRYSMRVWLDPDKLANLGITAVDVQNAIAEQNVQVAAGKIGQSPAPAGTPFEMQVNAVGRLSDPDAVRRDRRARQPGQRRGGAAARRRADRARRAAIRLVRLLRQGPDAWCSPSTRCRAPTRSTCSSGSRTRWTSCRSASPRAIAYAMHYDTTRFVVGLDARRADHARRGAAARRRRRLHLPAELAHDDHPDHRHPGVADRDAGGDGAVRLLAQHAEPARHGAGDRPRRRRRHRGGRERRAAARGRAAAARGDARRR